MVNRKVKWLTYTVLVGLIPVLLRMLWWSVSQERSMGLFNAVDFIVFGLIMHISNINEVEHFNDTAKSWKTGQNGISIAFISFYSSLFAAHLFGESHPALIDDKAIVVLSMILGLVSLTLSYTVYHRVSKFDEVSN